MQSSPSGVERRELERTVGPGHRADRLSLDALLHEHRSLDRGSGDRMARRVDHLPRHRIAPCQFDRFERVFLDVRGHLEFGDGLLSEREIGPGRIQG